MARVLAINGSYRDDGITDQVVDLMAQELHTVGVETEIILLRDSPIEFCLNCRECTQRPGEEPGICVQLDGMQSLVEKIEQADGFILASPTNFESVTALFKRFMERLVVYGYWPWGVPAPKYRKEKSKQKPAILVTSCAAPEILGRLFYSTGKQLKQTAKLIGARSEGFLMTGFAASDQHLRIDNKVQKKARKMARRLVEALDVEKLKP